MTHDLIDRMVREANPVPDLTVLEAVDASVLDVQRRTGMQTHDRVIVDEEHEKPRRNLLIGIAAAAAVILIGVLFVWQPTENAAVADQPAASAVEIATSFVEAYATYDVDRAASYLAADAFGEFGGNLENMRLQNTWREATGFRELLDSCEEQTTLSSGTVVRCTYDYHALRSEEIGLGPFGGSYFDFTVLEGKIVSVSGAFDYITNGFSSQVWEPFADWVAETHPEDVLVLYTDRSQTMQRVTEDSIAVWEERTREYVTVVGG